MPRVKSKEKYIQRFLEKVEKTPTCWLWKPKPTKWGYGIFWHEGIQKRAHRVAWLLFRDEKPGKLCICHKCDVRNCVNPQHLFIGTRNDNFIDAIKKGRINPSGETNHASKLSENDVRLIREWYGKKLTYEILGAFFGVRKQTICNIITRKEWKHI